MKRLPTFLLILFVAISAAHAQSEAATDTIRSGISSAEGLSPEEVLMPEVKEFDGFLIDMSMVKPSAPTLPRFTLEIPNASKDYSGLFQLNPNVTYSQGLSDLFSLSNSRYYSSNPFGLSSFFASPDNLQMGSFLLKNGMRINTYGEYDKDGRKVPSPSALPWEKNNFKGAFEIKSANGAFGIRIEVQHGNKSAY